MSVNVKTEDGLLQIAGNSWTVATTEKPGIIKPDGTTITVDGEGTISATTDITVDDALSDTSENPVQNKVIKSYIDDNLSSTANGNVYTPSGIRTASREFPIMSIYSPDCVVELNAVGKSFMPTSGGKTDLGSLNYTWKDIYSFNQLIVTSDRTKKKDISYIGEENLLNTSISDNMLIKLIMGLKPCVYRFIKNDSNRPHHGLISQDFEELLQTIELSDHAAFIKSQKMTETEYDEEGNIIKEAEAIPDEYNYALRYEEFIADIIRFCQILMEKNNQLEERLTKLEEKLYNNN